MRTMETEDTSAIDPVASRRDVPVVAGSSVRLPREHLGQDKLRLAVHSGDHDGRPSLRRGDGGTAAIAYLLPDAR